MFFISGVGLGIMRHDGQKVSFQRTQKLEGSNSFS